jgi:4-alpha-glucanotransferase
MELERSAGILLHPTSLPSEFGVGDLGEHAREFVEILAEAGQRWWQVLPLNPTGHGGSPYASYSAFAMNTTLIDPVELVKKGWVTQTELDDFRRRLPDTRDLGAVAAHKDALLDLAFARWDAGDHAAFETFAAEHASWLDDFALFAALKEANGGAAWFAWDTEIVRREDAALAGAKEALEEGIRRESFKQWVVDTQWRELRAHAAAHDVRIIGDIPIFVAMDSADVWANRDLFRVDARGRADVVAGVPPDYFSAEGQKWGNPLYDWGRLAESDYAWWVARVERAMDTTDLVRIDHFRAFADYWEVPADAPNAIQGQWLPGPSDAFFDAIRSALGEVPFIAEDLGIVTDEVYALRDRQGLPGMKIVQFAFGGEPDHPFLPHTYPERCVAYPGTHDNNTLVGWIDEASDDELHRARTYASASNDDLPRALMRRLL